VSSTAVKRIPPYPFRTRPWINNTGNLTAWYSMHSLLENQLHQLHTITRPNFLRRRTRKIW